MPYFDSKQTTAAFDRSKAANTAFVVVWLATTSMFASHLTDWNYRCDENYDLFSKTKKML